MRKQWTKKGQREYLGSVEKAAKDALESMGEGLLLAFVNEVIALRNANISRR